MGETAHCDRYWLLRVGVVRIIDKLIGHPDFTGAMTRDQACNVCCRRGVRMQQVER